MNQKIAIQTWNAAAVRTVGVDANGGECAQLTEFGLVLLGAEVPFGLNFGGGEQLDKRTNAARYLREWADALEGKDASPTPPAETATVVSAGIDVGMIRNALSLIWPADPTNFRALVPEIPDSIIARWDTETRIRVMEWAGAIHANAGDNDCKIPPVPPEVKPYFDASIDDANAVRLKDIPTAPPFEFGGDTFETDGPKW